MKSNEKKYPEQIEKQPIDFIFWSLWSLRFLETPGGHYDLQVFTLLIINN